MKVQIVIKQGKETEVYEVEHNNPYEWIKDVTDQLTTYQGTSLVFTDKKRKNSFFRKKILLKTA